MRVARSLHPGPVSGRLSLFDSRYPGKAAAAAFADALRLRLEEAPAIEAVGITRSLPFSSAGGRLITIEGRAPAADDRLPRVKLVSADRGCFDSLQIGVLRGRLLEADDDVGGRRVALLSAPLAACFRPGEEMIGKRFRFGSGSQAPRVEVFGPLPQVSRTAKDIERPVLRLPLAQAPTRSFSLTFPVPLVVPINPGQHRAAAWHGVRRGGVTSSFHQAVANPARTCHA